MTIKILIITLIIITLSTTTQADELDQVHSGDWQFSVAVGYGILENPRVKVDNVTTYILPTWYYYGENFYVENFTLGYSLYEKNSFVLDIQGQLNDDGLFFELDGIDKLFLSDVLGYTSIKQPIRPGKKIDYKSIERSISYLAGISATWYNPIADLTAGYFHDLTNVHNGNELQLNLRKKFILNSFAFGLELGATRKSANLISYYYSLTTEELAGNFSPYTPEAATNLHIKAVFNLPISNSLMLVASLKQTYLDDTIQQSFLINKPTYFAGFVGLNYAF